MKNLCMTSMCFLLICGAAAKAESAEDQNNGRMLLCVVIDKSPSPHWNQIGILSGQAIGLPDVGDGLILITAEMGRPSILADSSIESQAIPGRENLIRLLADLRQTFLIRPDVARAVSMAFEELNRHSKTYRCVLLLLTDGQLDDGQIRQIRRLATAFKARGWPLCITASPDANHQLFLAGSQNELQVMMLDRADLTKWFASIRPTEAPKIPATLSPIANSQLSINPGHVESPPQKIQIKTQAPGKDIFSKEPNLMTPPIPKSSASQPVVVPSQPIQVQSAHAAQISDKTKASEPLPTKRPSEPNLIRKRPTLKNSYGLIVFILLLLMLIIFVASPYLVMGAFSVGKFNSLSQKQGGEQENLPLRLIAFVGEQHLDLGDLNNMTDVTVGRGVGSTIFIDDKAVEEKHLRIFKAGKHLKVQNLAAEPALVNGMALSQNKKTVLDLPADIQLTPEVTVSLISESLEPQMEEQNHEN